jgi:hypothetical protein
MGPYPWLDTEWHQPENPPCLGDPGADGVEEFIPEPDAEPPF